MRTQFYSPSLYTSNLKPRFGAAASTVVEYQKPANIAETDFERLFGDAVRQAGQSGKTVRVTLGAEEYYFQPADATADYDLPGYTSALHRAQIRAIQEGPETLRADASTVYADLFIYNYRLKYLVNGDTAIKAYKKMIDLFYESLMTEDCDHKNAKGALNAKAIDETGIQRFYDSVDDSDLLDLDKSVIKSLYDVLGLRTHNIRHSSARIKRDSPNPLTGQPYTNRSDLFDWAERRANLLRASIYVMYDGGAQHVDPTAR